MRFIAAAAALVVLVSACTPPSAPNTASAPVQEDNTATATALAGNYLFTATNAGAEPCTLTLDENVGAAPGSHDVVIGEECATAYPFLTTLAGWKQQEDGAISLVSAEGVPLAQLTRNAEGAFQGHVQSEGKDYVLTPDDVWSDPNDAG